MLRRSTLAVFAFVCIEAIVSILARWPHQFTGQGNPDRVPREFLYLGTLLAPPLPLLLLFGLSALLTGKEDRLGFIATLGMIPMLAVMAVGSLGEALSAPSPDVPRSTQLAGGLFGALLFLALAMIATKDVSERWSSEEA